MIARLCRYLRDVLDPVDPHAVMQTWRKPTDTYDYDKAVAGARKAKRQTETGRPLPKPKRAAQTNVQPFRKVAR